MRRRQGLVALLAVIATSFLGIPQVLAGTDPPANVLLGFIDVDRTLTAAPPGPVYDVIGDVTVNAGVTLTIEPGVTLNFIADSDFLASGSYPAKVELIIRGSLAIDGTSTTVNLFSSNGGSSEWGEVRIEASGFADMKGIRISGHSVALNCLGTTQLVDSEIVGGGPFGTSTGLIVESDVTLSNVTIIDEVTALVVTAGMLSVLNSDIEGLAVVLDQTGGVSNMAESTLRYRSVGFNNNIIEAAGDLTLQNCDLLSGGAGVGVEMTSGSAVITGTTIFTAFNAISLAPGVTGEVWGCTLVGANPVFGTVGLRLRSIYN